MYDLRLNLIIGFHGCDIEVRDKFLNHPNEIVISQNPYDWLGHGMYFWENNYERAMQWAEDKKRRGAIETPAVIGAVLFLGYCCDLTDSTCIGNLANAYELMAEKSSSASATSTASRAFSCRAAKSNTCPGSNPPAIIPQLDRELRGAESPSRSDAPQ